MATARSSALAALEKTLEAKIRRRRRIRRGLIALGLLLLVLLFLRCEEEDQEGGSALSIKPSARDSALGGASVARIMRPEFVDWKAKTHAWGAELHRELEAYASALPECLSLPESPLKGVTWIFRFEAASGQIKHLRFEGAESEGATLAPSLERCLLLRLPEKVSLQRAYPAGWTEVQLVLRDRLYR